MTRQENISNRFTKLADRFANLKTRELNAQARFDKLTEADWNEFENLLSAVEMSANCAEQTTTLVEINLTKSGA